MQCPLKQTSCTFCNSWMHQLLCSKRSTVNPSNTPCCRTACRPDSPWWWGHLQGQGHLQDNLEAVSWASYWVRWQVLHTLRPCKMTSFTHFETMHQEAHALTCNKNARQTFCMPAQHWFVTNDHDLEARWCQLTLKPHKCTTNCASNARSTASH